MAVIKLTTSRACDVAGINRDRFNEYVAAGHYKCAPQTVPGRARLFDPDDMLTLFLFKRFVDDGYTIERAGTLACEVGSLAARYPDEKVIAYVGDYFGGRVTALVPDQVPKHEDWDKTLLSGVDVRYATYIRINKERELVAHYTAEAASIVGDPEAE